MLSTLVKKYSTWRERRSEYGSHQDTLNSYIQGVYPDEPSIGIGQAYQRGFLRAEVLCNYRWVRKSLHEGPIFLESWSDASSKLRSAQNKKVPFHYTPKEVLDTALGLFDESWQKGWSNTDASPAMEVINWIQTKEPHWFEQNLDEHFFSSSVSVWDSILYHDASTSRWAMMKWPERAQETRHPWKNWLEEDFSWMYSISYQSFLYPDEKWWATVEHMAQWSPFNAMNTASLRESEVLSRAIELMGAPNPAALNMVSSVHRGIHWFALVHDLPPGLTKPIGAALGVSWPGMDPICFAIGRHFYPNMQHASPWGEGANIELSQEKDAWCNVAASTMFLYDDPQLWCTTLVQSWDAQLTQPAQWEIPENAFDESSATIEKSSM